MAKKVVSFLSFCVSFRRRCFSGTLSGYLTGTDRLDIHRRQGDVEIGVYPPEESAQSQMGVFSMDSSQLEIQLST